MISTCSRLASRATVLIAALLSAFAIFHANPAAAFPIIRNTDSIGAGGTWPQLLLVRDICGVRREGRRKVTYYCNDPYVCDPTNMRKCKPGPELQRKLDEARRRREDELRKLEEKLKREVRELETQQRRMRRRQRMSNFNRRANPFYSDRRASCSDITGLSGAASSRPCKSAGSRVMIPRTGGAVSTARPRPVAQVRTNVQNTIQFKYGVILPLIEQLAALPANDARRDQINRQVSDAVAKSKASGVDVDAWVKSKLASASARAPKAPVSGAAKPSPNGSAGAGPRLYDIDCKTAGEVERQTYAYLLKCHPERISDGRLSQHRPNPDPKELGYQARQVCGSYSRATQQCFGDFKLKAILEKNPGFRDYCEKEAAKNKNSIHQVLRKQAGLSVKSDRELFFECVDRAYLYGMDGSQNDPRNSPRDVNRLRDLLIRELSKKTDSSNAGGSPKRVTPPGPRDTRCQPGFGMKPTAGAFGGYSCQALGGLARAPGRRDATSRAGSDDNRAANPATAAGDGQANNSSQPNASPGAPDPVRAFEQRVREVAANAVVAAAATVKMPAEDREACLGTAYQAAYSALKGGAQPVPEKCQPLADAARVELAYYAGAHVDASNPAVEELLAGLVPGDRRTVPPNDEISKAAARAKLRVATRAEILCQKFIVARQDQRDAKGGLVKPGEPVPDYCRAYVRLAAKPDERNAAAAAPFYLRESDKAEACKLAEEFYKEHLLPPDYADMSETERAHFDWRASRCMDFGS